MAKTTKKVEYVDFTRLISQKESALARKEMELYKATAARDKINQEITHLKQEIRELKRR